MANRVTNEFAVKPILNYPRNVETGKTYLLTIDLQPLMTHDQWPYSEEEASIYCLLNGTPLFQVEPLGEPAIVIHRFGGTYGPARFLVTATLVEEGTIRITLVNGWGVPLGVLETPVIRRMLEDGKLSDLASRRRATQSSGSKFNTRSSGGEFQRSLAVVIGIDDYRDGVPSLATPVNDAQALAEILRDRHGYDVELILNGAADLAALRHLLEAELPKLLTKDDRLLF